MIVKEALAALPGESEFKRVDILVKNGKIKKIGNPGSFSAEDSPLSGQDSVDARGLLLFPGAIDPHVHFDEPGFTHREDFLHGSSEAARGGVTTVIDMPCTSIPPVTSLENLKRKLAAVSASAVVDFGFFGGINGKSDDTAIAETIDSLSSEVLGFKCYFISGMESFAAVSERQFALAVQACAEAGRPLLLHAEDPKVIAKAEARLAKERQPELKSAEAQLSKLRAVPRFHYMGGPAPRESQHWRDYYASRPMEAETAACATALRLAGPRASVLHIVHVSTAQAALMVDAAGASCETCAHYLAFDEEDFELLGSALKTAPPVKEPGQKALLWKLLASGEIDFVSSDHAGAPEYEKFTNDPMSAYGGIPGTGMLFPYLLSEGLLAKRLDLQRFLRATAGAAAERYGLSGGKGSISPGKDADFVLVDPEASTLVEAGRMLCKNTISPFTGMRLAGSVAGTFVRGSCVFSSPRLSGGQGRAGIFLGKNDGKTGIIAPPGSGRFITWGYK
ncbi:MAG: amidohydrolase family protein [Spirochaetia bacterium]|nr:amidohydrolase family protein [Spirochaetia bacterium]